MVFVVIFIRSYIAKIAKWLCDYLTDWKRPVDVVLEQMEHQDVDNDMTIHTYNYNQSELN